MNPTAKVTGYYGGYATIAPFDGALVFAQGQVLYSYDELLKAIAEERESCAKLCDDLRDCEDNPKAYRNGAGWCGERIRARGKVK